MFLLILKTWVLGGAFAAGPVLPKPDLLNRFLTDRNFQLPADQRFPRQITQLLNRVALREGKRVRPLLCFLSAGTLGGKPHSVRPLACVVEFVHTASLLHDDVLDVSADRRGKPSLWAMTSVKSAVLNGNYLLAEAIRMAAELEEKSHVLTMLESIKEMTRGEVLQSAILKRGSCTLEDWNQIADAKTGVLFIWSLSAPAREYGLHPEVGADLEELGRILGRLFQARDDLLDAPEERGEVNRVLLRAAEIEGISPFAKEFRPDSLAQAAEETLAYLKAEGTRAEALIEKISKSADAIWEDQPFATDTGYQKSCVQSLIGLTRLLTGG
ncbi:polyprenyl synthetase family protein [bacterium]|nr:polyprenyl synthetase family protein [bacterium]